MSHFDSARRAETARVNGAKSHGPVTKKGLAISSQNSLRHGLTSKQVVLPGESSHDYERHRESYRDQFRPQGAAELDLIDAIAASRWKLLRIAAIETNLFAK